jgi:pimeloyl-ACP methyl ester carboxylesterase
MANTVQLKGSMLYPTTGFPTVSCDDLRKIKTPVLLVSGDKSPLLFPSIIKELDRCLPNTQKATLPNTTHGLETENPSEFNKVVLGFIDKH